MPTSTETLPADIAADIANLEPLEKSESWVRNRHKFTKGGSAVRFLSWLEPGLPQSVLEQLGEHDKDATEEAYDTKMLDHYEPGEQDPDNEAKVIENWCKWKSHEAARAAIHRPKHLGGAVYALTERVYRYAMIEVYDIIPTDDPENPEQLELVKQVTLPEIQAHYDAKVS